jgi:hypothetical protein
VLGTILSCPYEKKAGEKVRAQLPVKVVAPY